MTVKPGQDAAPRDLGAALALLDGHLPPATNRGGFVTASAPAPAVTWAGIHWLTLTVCADPRQVQEMVCEALSGLLLEPARSGIWTYQNRVIEGNTGAFVAWTDGRPECAVNLTGSACELLGTAGLLALVQRLFSVGVHLRITRLDLAWDTDALEPAQFYDAWHSGRCVTRAKAWRWEENHEGDTFYVGKRGDSDARLLRAYNRRGPTRVELELHGRRATGLMAHLAGADLSDWSRVALGALLDFVDFRDVGADSNVTRCPRLDWWAAFTDGASALHIPIPARVPTLETMAHWLRHSVAPALSLVFDAEGDNAWDWFADLMQHGLERRTAARQRLLDITASVKAAVSPPGLRV